MNALQTLNRMADEAKAARYPNVPANYRIKSKYNDKTANALTKCIIDFVTLLGGHATRIQSTGMIRDGVGWTFGSTRKGTADIHAVLSGRHFSVEVKIGSDRQSKAQKQVQQEIERAGGIYLIARTFQQVYDDLQRLTGAIPVTDAATVVGGMLAGLPINHFISL